MLGKLNAQLLSARYELIAVDGGVMASYSGSWCSLGAEMSWNGHWRFECSEGVVVWEHDKVYAGASSDKLEEVALLKPERTGQTAVLAEFLSALEENRAPETDAHDNLKSLAMVFKSIESSESGGVVSF